MIIKHKTILSLSLSTLAGLSILTPAPASAAVLSYFGWGFSDNETYQEVEYWVDATGKVLGAVGVFIPAVGQAGLVIKTIVSVVDIIDPSAVTILSGRVTKDFDPSYQLINAGWYGEFGADPSLPAPPINSSSFDQTLLQSQANPAMQSSNIFIDQTNGRVVFEFDWGTSGFLPTLNQDATGHFNILGLYFLPPSPVSPSLIGTSPEQNISSIVGSFEDVALNGTNAQTYMLCSNGYCGEPVPEPLTILGSATALGFGAFFKRKLKASKSTEKVS